MAFENIEEYTEYVENWNEELLDCIRTVKEFSVEAEESVFEFDVTNASEKKAADTCERIISYIKSYAEIICDNLDNAIDELTDKMNQC